MFIIYGLTVFLLILVIWFTTIYSCNHISTTLLPGFWQIDPEFGDEAELDLFLLYIGEKEAGIRHAYVLAKNKHGFIINDQAELRMRQSWSSCFNMSACSKKTYDVNFKGIEEYEHFPAKQQLVYYPEKAQDLQLKLILLLHQIQYSLGLVLIFIIR